MGAVQPTPMVRTSGQSAISVAVAMAVEEEVSVAVMLVGRAVVMSVATMSVATMSVATMSVATMLGRRLAMMLVGKPAMMLVGKVAMMLVGRALMMLAGRAGVVLAGRAGVRAKKSVERDRSDETLRCMVGDGAGTAWRISIKMVKGERRSAQKTTRTRITKQCPVFPPERRIGNWIDRSLIQGRRTRMGKTGCGLKHSMTVKESEGGSFCEYGRLAFVGDNTCSV